MAEEKKPTGQEKKEESSKAAGTANSKPGNSKRQHAEAMPTFWEHRISKNSNQSW